MIFMKKNGMRVLLGLKIICYIQKEEIVKFLNRYIRKKISNDNYLDIFPQIEINKNLKGLDFSCGNGRQTILLEEFNIEGYGCVISNEAIKMAKKMRNISTNTI